MTNTNDFRKYSYQNDPATLIEAFTYTRGSQAAKPRPVPRERDDIKVRPNVGIKNKGQLVQEQKLSNKTMLRIAVVALVLVFAFGLVLSSFAMKNQLTREIAAAKIDVANAESEYISLESELNSLVSISMIDKYAVEKLGMTKVRSNQIQYIDVAAFRASREKKLASEQNVDSGLKHLKNKIKGHN